MSVNSYSKIYKCNVEIVRKNIKNVYLYLLAPNGDMKITMPNRFTETDLTAFINKKHDWIVRKQAQLRAMPVASTLPIENSSTITLLGRSFPIIIEKGIKSKVVLKNDSILLTSVEDSQELYQSLIHSLCRKELAKQLDFLVPLWSAKMKLMPDYVGIRKMRTRWGSCNPRAKRLWFSLYLAEKDISCIEYVVVHELAHLIEPSHSKVFHEIVASYLPDWKLIKNVLNGKV